MEPKRIQELGSSQSRKKLFVSSLLTYSLPIAEWDRNEQDLRGKHKIAPNGYNVGRDLVVEKARGGSRYLGRSWETNIEYVEGLLEPGKDGTSTLELDHDLSRTKLSM